MFISIVGVSIVCVLNDIPRKKLFKVTIDKVLDRIKICNYEIEPKK